MTSQVSSTTRLVTFGTIAVLFACFFSRQFFTELGHDQVSYLFEADRFLGGAEPYGPHLSETNPPLIIWFSAIPVLLGRLLHVTPPAALRFTVLAMLLAVMAWIVSILRRSSNPVFANPITRTLFACAFLFAGFAVGGYDFGQREHLLIILITPYLFAVGSEAVSSLSRGERCALGIAAGLSVWFKPHDVLILVALELLVAVRTRSLRRLLAPEFLAFLATAVAVLLLVFVATPLYFRQIVPLLFDTYWALGTMTTLALALTLKRYMAAVAVLFAIYLIRRRSLRSPFLFLALLISSLAASVAYDLQHTDWRYHGYPHMALFILAAACLLLDLLSPLLDRLATEPRLVSRLVFASSAFFALGLLGALSMHHHMLVPLRPDNELDRLLGQYQPSTTVTVFSTGVPALHSAYKKNITWGSRFAHLWMMPALLQNELGPTGPPAPFKRLSPETLTRLSALQRSQSTEDLNYWQPKVIIFERCNYRHPCQGIEGKNFSMLSWFLRDKNFAEVFSHYQQGPSSFEDYDIYLRVR
jgi:hypothetical protein